MQMYFLKSGKLLLLLFSLGIMAILVHEPLLRVNASRLTLSRIEKCIPAVKWFAFTFRYANFHGEIVKTHNTRITNIRPLRWISYEIESEVFCFSWLYTFLIFVAHTSKHS